MAHVYFYQTDIGTLVIAENGQGITDIYFGDQAPDSQHTVMETPMIKIAHEQLREYFAGTRRQFDFPLDLQGTEFQKKVWKALMEIPYGHTYSYGQIAAAIGQPSVWLTTVIPYVLPYLAIV